RRNDNKICSFGLLPSRWFFLCIVLILCSSYLSIIISRSLCDNEKNRLLKESSNQIEEELNKLRKCLENESKYEEKINDLQWEIEKLKRANNELNEQLKQTQSEKLKLI